MTGIDQLPVAAATCASNQHLPAARATMALPLRGLAHEWLVTGPPTAGNHLRLYGVNGRLIAGQQLSASKDRQP